MALLRKSALLVLAGFLFVVSALAFVTGNSSALARAGVDLGALSPDLAISSNEVSIRAAEGAVDAGTVQRLGTLLAFEPLAHEPFVYAAEHALRRGDPIRAEELAAEGLRRRPRSRVAHFVLLRSHLAQQDIGMAAQAVAALNRLIPGAQEQFAQQLTLGLSNIASARMLGAELAAFPGIYGATLQQASRSETVALEPLMAFAAARPSTLPSDEYLHAFLQGLVRRGAVAQARDFWRRSFEESGDGSAYLFNEDFSEHEAAPPFNWRLTTSPEGIAEYTQEGVTIDYYGKRPISLLEQLINLPTGRYEIVATGRSDGSEADLNWNIRCTDRGGVLLDTPLRLAASNSRVTTSFTVPQGCDNQVVALLGEPNDRRFGGSTATLERVRIVDAGD